MLKRILLPLLLAALAAYLFYNAYLQRNVATFLWAVSFTLILITSFTRFMRDTLLVIVSLTITIALVEMGLNYAPGLLSRKNPDTGINTAKDKTVFAYFDPNQSYNTSAYWHLGEFGSQPQPGVFTAKKVASNGAVLYDTIFSIGEDGFRITPKYGFKLEDNQQHRINFLGDSFTFGEGVADNQTMAYYVGELIFKQSSSSPKTALPSTKVKNYGIHGWGVHQSLAVLQSKLDTNADIQFVMTAPWHASRVACADFFTMGSPKYKLLTAGYVERDGYCRSFGWIEHSPRALRAFITSSKIFNLIQESLFVENDQDKQIKLYIGVLKTIQADVKKRGQKLIIGFIKANDNWFIGNYNNEKILAELKAAGITSIDLTLADKNENLESKFYIHELDKHPTAIANLERAKKLLDNFSR